MQAHVNTHTTRPDGSRDSFASVRCEMKERPLLWQEQGLSFTASGYGNKIPTRLVVLFNGRWRRVYVKIHSNNGTLFIGKNLKDGFTVHPIED